MWLLHKFFGNQNLKYLTVKTLYSKRNVAWDCCTNSIDPATPAAGSNNLLASPKWWCPCGGLVSHRWLYHHYSLYRKAIHLKLYVILIWFSCWPKEWSAWKESCGKTTDYICKDDTFTFLVKNYLRSTSKSILTTEIMWLFDFDLW